MAGTVSGAMKLHCMGKLYGLRSGPGAIRSWSGWGFSPWHAVQATEYLLI